MQARMVAADDDRGASVTVTVDVTATVANTVAVTVTIAVTVANTVAANITVAGKIPTTHNIENRRVPGGEQRISLRIGGVH